MCITEYDEAETLKAIGEEKYAEGRAEERAERDATYKAHLDKMVKDGVISKEAAQQLLNEVNSENQ